MIGSAAVRAMIAPSIRFAPGTPGGRGAPSLPEPTALRRCSIPNQMGRKEEKPLSHHRDSPTVVVAPLHLPGNPGILGRRDGFSGWSSCDVNGRGRPAVPIGTPAPALIPGAVPPVDRHAGPAFQDPAGFPASPAAAAPP